jgi:hypothetical protein
MLTLAAHTTAVMRFVNPNIYVGHSGARVFLRANPESSVNGTAVLIPGSRGFAHAPE